MIWINKSYGFLHTWGPLIGLGFDIVGACLVYCGVRISFDEALRLEAPTVSMTIGDIGGKDIIQKANAASNLRAKERLRAKNFALIGLLFFILGFFLQTANYWPN